MCYCCEEMHFGNPEAGLNSDGEHSNLLNLVDNTRQVCLCFIAIITRKACCHRELPQDAGHLYRKFPPSGNALNRNNTETIGKHGKVVEKPLYKCISEGLMHVTAWYHGTPGP